MRAGAIIFIVSQNQLEAHGLASILTEHFAPSTISITSAPTHQQLARADFIFLSRKLYTKQKTFFAHYHKHIILIDDGEGTASFRTTFPTILSTQPETKLIEKLRTLLTYDSKRTKIDENELSPRERDVLKLVAQGLLNKEIAETLNISLHTVISHRKNITRKLGIKTVAGLTLYALMNGIITPHDAQ